MERITYKGSMSLISTEDLETLILGLQYAIGDCREHRRKISSDKYMSPLDVAVSVKEIDAEIEGFNKLINKIKKYKNGLQENN